MIEVYQTHDIVLAAALKVSGFELATITVTGKQGLFHFLNVDVTFLHDYDFERLRVEPRAHNNAIRIFASAIKNMVEKGTHV